jgi:hypothetical protein
MDKTSLQKILELKKTYCDEIAKAGKELFAEELKSFFAAHPNVKALRWTQYTPSFNDGDPCRFSLSDVQVQLDDPPKRDDDEERDPEDWENSFEAWDLPDSHAELQAAMRSLSQLLHDAKDACELVFGDGSEIIATREKIEVNEFDCGF